MLTMPTPLNPKHFHSKQVVQQYNKDVADFLQQQADADYNSRTSKRSKQRRERYSDDN